MHALLANRGQVFAFQLLADSAAKKTAPLRAITMHEPTYKRDEHSRICDMTLWRARGADGARVVTVGADGNISVAALQGTAEEPGGLLEDAWHATTRGSGPSAAHAYAPAHAVAVADGAAVAFTASQNEPFGYVWDLGSSKKSAAGKMHCKTPRLASGTPSKVWVMCAAASASGLFAYSNSNNGDDATLKIVVPC